MKWWSIGTVISRIRYRLQAIWEHLIPAYASKGRADSVHRPHDRRRYADDVGWNDRSPPSPRHVGKTRATKTRNQSRRLEGTPMSL